MDPPFSRSAFLQKISILCAGAVLSPYITPLVKGSHKRIRLAVIGCASVSNMYLPHLSKAALVELVSVCDIKPQRVAAQAKKV